MNPRKIGENAMYSGFAQDLKDKLTVKHYLVRAHIYLANRKRTIAQCCSCAICEH